MKTLGSVLMVCLFIGISFSNTKAQNDASNVYQAWVESTFWSPVFCDGVMVDALEGGTIRVHVVERYLPGVSFTRIAQIKGEVTSDLTGEVFKIRETDKYSWSPGSPYIVKWRYNLIGNMGTHYHGTITYDIWAGVILEVSQTVCN